MVLLTVRSFSSFFRTFSYSAGVLQLALLDKLFRGAENLLFIETKTKRHRERTPAFFLSNARDIRRRRTGPNLAGRFPDETPQNRATTIAELDHGVR